MRINICEFQRRLKITPLVLMMLLPVLTRCGVSAMPPLPVTPEGPVLPVAVLLPTTGEMAVMGQQLRQGIDMAMNEANNQGGILGRRIRWQLYDTGCDYQTASQAVRQAIDDGYQLMVGPLCTEAAIAAAQQAAAASTLLLVPAATHPLVTVDASGQIRPTVFSLAPLLTDQGQAAARLAIDRLQSGSAAVIIEAGDEYSIAVGQAFADRFSEQGGTVLAQPALNPYQPDIDTQLEAVFQQQPQLLFVPGTPALINRVARVHDGWPTAQKPTLLGSDRWSAPDVDRSLVAGSYFTTWFALPPAHPPAQTWAEAYKVAYAVEPEPLAGLGYEAASVLLTAIRLGQDSSPPVVAEILQTHTFSGITAPLRFDRRHNPVRPIPVLTINDGRLEYVTAIQIEPR